MASEDLQAGQRFRDRALDVAEARPTPVCCVSTRARGQSCESVGASEHLLLVLWHRTSQS